MHAPSPHAVQCRADSAPVPSARQALLVGVARWTLVTVAALAAYSTVVLHGHEPTLALSGAKNPPAAAEAAAPDWTMHALEKRP